MKLSIVDYKNSTAFSSLLSTIKSFLSSEDIVSLYELTGETNYLPCVYMDTLEKLFEKDHPDILVFPHTDYGVELASRLSATFSLPSYTNVVNIERTEEKLILKKEIYNRNLSGTFQAHFPICITISSQNSNTNNQEEDLIQNYYSVMPKTSVFSSFLPKEEELFVEKDSISSSPLLFVCGRGLNNEEKIEKMKKAAHLAGAKIGCSRPVFMDGRMEAAHLVGMSGHICSPELCLVIGVSGSAAFLTGISKSKKIIAINTDEHAPIFSYCDFGMIGDGSQILDELILQLEVKK